MNPKMKKRLDSLSKELQPVFERLVTEYQYYCVVKYGRAFVSYEILADLIEAGWRPTHDPFIDPKKSIFEQFEP